MERNHTGALGGAYRMEAFLWEGPRWNECDSGCRITGIYGEHILQESRAHVVNNGNSDYVLRRGLRILRCLLGTDLHSCTGYNRLG